MVPIRARGARRSASIAGDFSTSSSSIAALRLLRTRPAADAERRMRVSCAPSSAVVPPAHHCPRTPTMNMRSEKFECAGWSGHTR